ncbi:MAG TPA: EAL domain-containing protein, partial [Chromatiales bacterium]|nr:EAL domain-containing protein [Chromatiales bacterium]
FVQRVQSLLAASGRPPERVEIEITEGVLVGQHTHAPELLNALNELGVRIAIDDFGTGYSSLAYLSHLPIDTLKVDQSFVRNLSQDPANAVLTRTIIAMGHSMGLEVVAEGVEDHDSLTFLRQHRCDFAQGYYFARPMPPEDLVAHLQGNPDQALR